jgi:transcriptional regulator with XRE-family HTH domain
MPHRTDEHIGARIAEQRAARGLTQEGLAMRANVSKSLLSKVETGSRQATPALVAACARALGVPARVLEGQPEEDATEEERLLAALAPVRSTLDLYDLSPEEDVRPRPLAQLREAVKRTNQVAQSADYRPMAEGLPALLIELHAAAHLWTGADQTAAWGLLAEAYRCAHTVGIALNYRDLSATALSRMDWAAQHAGARSAALRAAREYLRVTAYLRAEDYAACQRLNASGNAHLEGADDRDPGVLVARGQLHLGASVIAARVGDRDAVEGHLEEAGRIAERSGEDLETFWFGFGPTNVQVHGVMTHIELEEYGTAVDAARNLRFPEAWLPTRIGHHHFDLARAYQQMGRPRQALAELRKARWVAPQQARRHPSVRRTVLALREERRRVPGLAEYAAWIRA